MKLYRIFISIDLPDNVIDTLLAYKEKWPELPARWTSKENLHLTLLFLGNTSEQELEALTSAMRQIGKRHASFELAVSGIQYGPSQEEPRMIWAIIHASQELADLRKDIETGIAGFSGLNVKAGKQEFSPHATLARLNVAALARMELEELPQIQEEMKIEFQVQGFDIMSSKPQPRGIRYNLVEHIELSKR